MERAEGTCPLVYQCRLLTYGDAVGVDGQRQLPSGKRDAAGEEPHIALDLVRDNRRTSGAVVDLHEQQRQQVVPRRSTARQVRRCPPSDPTAVRLWAGHGLTVPGPRSPSSKMRVTAGSSPRQS
ncbi:hypothetical protein [Streptomyces cellulosae]|uniref:Uncharacterized protein n=1 Tax=Streptomyces cellulosae TaxID=1968 RepID=A0ABW7YKI2_STRCE